MPGQRSCGEPAGPAAARPDFAWARAPARPDRKLFAGNLDPCGLFASRSRGQSNPTKRDLAQPPANGRNLTSAPTPTRHAWRPNRPGRDGARWAATRASCPDACGLVIPRAAQARSHWRLATRGIPNFAAQPAARVMLLCAGPPSATHWRGIGRPARQLVRFAGPCGHCHRGPRRNPRGAHVHPLSRRDARPEILRRIRWAGCGPPGLCVGQGPCAP